MRPAVVVRSRVSSGGAKEMSVLSSPVDGIFHCPARAPASPAVVTDGKIHRRAVGHCVYGIGYASPSRVRQELEGNQLRFPCNACHLQAIVTSGSNGTCYVSTVAVSVHRVVVIVCEIPSIDVIDVTVSVIVLAVAGYFTWVFPDVPLQVLVVVVDAGVDHRNDHGMTASASSKG